MKKILFCLLLIMLSATCFSQAPLKKNKKIKPTVQAIVVKPCESKEDILKKLEEKKKEQETPKAFSLQGGDTGCKIN